MSTLFDKLNVGDIELANRIIYSPLTRSRANDEGVQPDYAVDYYVQRTSAGLLITEATNVSPMAKGYIRTPGIYSKEQIAAWREVATAVHKQDGRIFMQIFHTGRIALPDFLPDGINQPVAPSAVQAEGQNYTDEGMKDFVKPRELATDEVKAIVLEFATAAKNAVSAGFDGVELHAANGYLIHQFLGTNTNLRTDEYGGSDENRARFLLEIVDAISGEIGSQKIGVKLSPEVSFNSIEDGNAEEFYPYLIEALNKKGLAYLHIGLMGSREEGSKWHQILRPLFKGVYFANGGFDKELGEKLLEQDGADAIVYGKLFLANPDLPRRFRLNAGLNDWDESTFYSPGRKGYTDYPSIEESLIS